MSAIDEPQGSSARPGEGDRDDRQQLGAADGATGRSALQAPIADLARAAAERVDGSLREELEAVARKLDSTLRVAVAGRVSSGKSTLVNALLRRRVAPTDATECTRVVTWFEHGRPERASVELHDGTTVALELGNGGQLPRELGVDEQDVRALRVTLDADALRSMTLIDTPGLGALGDASARSEELLGIGEDASLHAAACADAIVFVLSGGVFDEELDVIRRFQDASGSSCANAVGVLSHADRLGSHRADPWESARELADELASSLAGELATVMPVAGLLAQTACTGALSEADALGLTRIAATTRLTRDVLLASADGFRARAIALDPYSRVRLLELLDLRGLSHVLGRIDAGVRGGVALRRELDELSGMPALRATLFERLGRSEEALLARGALKSLRSIAYRRTDGPDGAAMRWLLDELEQLLLDPRMGRLLAIEAWERCAADELHLPPPLRDELRRIAGDEPIAPHGSRAERLEELAEVDRAWATFAFAVASPDQQQVARLVRDMYVAEHHAIEAEAEAS